MAELKPLKAYKVWMDDGEGATIVFAETRNQAKVLALSCDCCEDAEYIGVCVRRMKGLDKLYKGKAEMDWWDTETRIVLVRDYGWACFDPSWECDECAAKQHCRWHEQEVGDSND